MNLEHGGYVLYLLVALSFLGSVFPLPPLFIHAVFSFVPLIAGNIQSITIHIPLLRLAAYCNCLFPAVVSTVRCEDKYG